MGTADGADAGAGGADARDEDARYADERGPEAAGPEASGPEAGGSGGADDAHLGLDPHRETLRPQLFWFNVALTVALLATLITQVLPIPVLFLLGAVEIARASLAGQALHMSSPLVPAVYVLIGMARVEFGDHTRFAVKWATLTSLVVLASGLLFGIL